MDGVIGDKLFRGRRVRLLTTEEAVAILPAMIMDMRRGNVQIISASSAGGPDVVLLQVHRRPDSSILLLRPDFELCKKIALTASKKLFPADRSRDIEARIKAWVELEFADRP